MEDIEEENQALMETEGNPEDDLNNTLLNTIVISTEITD